jgi:ankyrin repeat protein
MVLSRAPFCLEVVQLLLDHNADVNSQDKGGDTPLSITIFLPAYAEEERGVDVVRRLLEHGADPNTCLRKQWTYIHQASSHGWLEVTRLLLIYGAKVDGKDNEGKTPHQVASENGHHEIAKLLSEHVELPVVPQL